VRRCPHRTVTTRPIEPGEVHDPVIIRATHAWLPMARPTSPATARKPSTIDDGEPFVTSGDPEGSFDTHVHWASVQRATASSRTNGLIQDLSC